MQTTPARLQKQTSSTQVDVSLATSSEEWNGFLKRHQLGSFYHLFQWQQINKEAFGHRSLFLLARDASEVRGVLPLTLVSSPLFGRILCSMPFVNYGGPCALDELATDALVESAKRHADEIGADYLELRCMSQLTTQLPVSTRKVSMTIELAPDPDTLWKAFGTKHRKNVNRAYKNGLSVHAGGIELLPTFYAVLAESWRDLGTPLYAPSYFESVMQAFPNDTRIFVCQHASGPVAVAFTGYFNGVVEGLWAGGRPAARRLDANYVLYWEMIRDACLRGFRRFHLGRSTSQSGSEEFKRKWNGESKQLYWYFYRPSGGEMPALNVDNPKYKLAINAWRHTPLWMTRMIGPWIARAIP